MGFTARPNCPRAFALHSKPHLESSGRCLNQRETPFRWGDDHGPGWPQGLPLRSFPLGLLRRMHVTNTSTRAGYAQLLSPISGVSGRGESGRQGGNPGGTPNPRSARPQGGRNRPPAAAPRPSPNPSNPRGLGVQPSRGTTTRRPADPVEPSRKHSPAGRKGARSSGLASLCPAHAPPLASGASALALSTRLGISFRAPRACVRTAKPRSEGA